MTRYDNIIDDSLGFSPDSRHLIYAASDQSGQFLVVDGKEGKRYDSIIFVYDGGSRVFDTEDHFHYLARRGNGIYLVEEITATSV